MNAIRRGDAAAREELARRANAAMAGHDRRMEAINSRWAECRAETAAHYARAR
jgi:hypothetical protein